MGKIVKNHWSLYLIIKKKFFCIYEMFNITKETLNNNGIEVIVDSVNALWLNEKNIEKTFGHKNLPAISNKYDKIYKKSRYELVDKLI